MKKILIISEAFWSPSKGTARYTLSLINELKFISDVHLLVPKFNDFSNYEIENIVIHNVDVDIDSKIGLLNKKARVDFFKYVKKNINSICKEGKIDLIHIVYGHFIIKAIPKNINVPVLWTCHNMPPNESHPPLAKHDFFSKTINSLYKLLVRIKHTYLINTSNIDRVIAISEQTQADITDWIWNKKICIIGNGCDFSVNSNCHKVYSNLNILTVGGIKPHKNIHIIPEISAYLNELKINHKWTVIGPEMNDNYVDLFMSNIKKHKCNVDFLGMVSNKELIEQYEKSNLYVHLSKEEGFCLTILEAASFGIASVATNVGAIPEIVSDLDNGLLCEPYADVISSTIVKFYNAPYEFNSGNALSSSVFNSWSWGHIAEEHRLLYMEVLSS